MTIKTGLYKGWNILSAIKDLMNSKIDYTKNNVYPDWFKSQFEKTK